MYLKIKIIIKIMLFLKYYIKYIGFMDLNYMIILITAHIDFK
jgi:hypothetical protein